MVSVARMEHEGMSEHYSCEKGAKFWMTVSRLLKELQ